MIQTIITMTTLMAFIIIVSMICYVLITEPKDARLVRSGRYYYIEIKKLTKWHRCDNMTELKEVYENKHKLKYPFGNKKDAELAFDEIYNQIHRCRKKCNNKCVIENLTNTSNDDGIKNGTQKKEDFMEKIVDKLINVPLK